MSLRKNDNVASPFQHPKPKAHRIVSILFRRSHKKADSCEFGDKKGEFIRDSIVCGIHSDTVRKLLLREPDLTLEKAKELCVMHELVDIDSKDINVDPSVQTNSVNSVRARPKPGDTNNKFQQSGIASIVGSHIR